MADLNLEQYPKNYYLTGSTTNIVGPKQVGANTPYQKLMTAFKNIDKETLKDNPDAQSSELISNKNYDLYGFKHSANIFRYNQNKWRIHELQKLNGHTNPSTTEMYLKKLGLFTDIEDLESPSI